MRLGFVYPVFTSLKDPPDRKYVLCVCEDRNLCLWFNTEPRYHGIGQIPVRAGDHDYLVRNSYLDCSRVVLHPEEEIDEDLNLPEPRIISATLARKIHLSLTAQPPSKLPASQYQTIMACLSGIFET